MFDLFFSPMKYIWKSWKSWKLTNETLYRKNYAMNSKLIINKN